MSYYIGFFAMDLNRMMKFYSIRKPTKAAYGFFGKVTGPYETEKEVDDTMKVLKRAYGYQSNPAVSERQRRFMCADLGRLRSGKKTRTGMREGQLRDFCKKNPENESPTQQKLSFIRRVGAKLYGKAKLSYILKTLDTKADIDAAYKLLKDSISIRKISASQIKRGTEHELEHTKDRAVARKIAMDHLREDPYYYTHLAKMEKQYKKNAMSPEKALRLTRKVIAYAKDLHKDYKENPGKSFHDQKFIMYMKELDKYKVGSEPYIKTLARAYEHLDSAKHSDGCEC